MSETGRRSAMRRTLSPTGVIAVVLPLLTVGALALVRPDPASIPAQGAQEVRPDRVDLVCPSALTEPLLAVAVAGAEVAGTATAIPESGDAEPVEVEDDAVTRLSSPEVTELRGEGDLASSLIAARVQERGLAATDCVLPRPDYWFSGVGAGAEHVSVLELTNPDDGPAVADVTVWARSGQLDVPTLRGVIVPGGETLRLDLAQEVPRRTELGISVVVSRGRLAATVEDEIPSLGARAATRGWLPESGEPATEQLLLGLAAGEGSDTLVLTNPGADEARVELRVVTQDASFVPEGLAEVRVGPMSVETVTLSEVLRRQVQEGALGLELSATEPVSATLRSVVGEDLVHATRVAGSTNAMTALVPPGEARLVLAGAEGSGIAQVTAYDADGRRLQRRRVELTDGSGGEVELRRGTALVRVSSKRTTVAAAVVVTGRGATVVPLEELVRRSLVPAVRPGLL
ncbi:DUF5719 family protein [Nocardioides coralli]|uniref:DUF5719 family protein n=1 Tax=Nocardioides coralli TaxID=2872154 RepID=UPI001CA3EB72|nr:DUF5719 family protein [Nocardioides coralli]QZY30019.1 hypothetical protein K6T13_04850 [Nocardioides coralli]